LTVFCLLWFSKICDGQSHRWCIIKVINLYDTLEWIRLRSPQNNYYKHGQMHQCLVLTSINKNSKADFAQKSNKKSCFIIGTALLLF